MPVIPDTHPASPNGLPGLRSQIIALAGFLALSAAAWALASVPIILNSNGWYAGSAKAPWMPPSWMFRTTWILLYAGVAVAAWRVWRKGGLTGGARAGYVVQLLLNTAWPVAFFGFLAGLSSFSGAASRPTLCRSASIRSTTFSPFGRSFGRITFPARF